MANCRLCRGFAVIGGSCCLCIQYTLYGIDRNFSVYGGNAGNLRGDVHAVTFLLGKIHATHDCVYRAGDVLLLPVGRDGTHDIVEPDR